MDIQLASIGVIHTPFTQPNGTPIQSVRSTARGWVEVFPEFVDGMKDLEEFSHIFLLYRFHQTQQVDLLVEPFLDDRKHGIFATRHPFRPNHIGISVVRVMGVQGSRIDVEGVDMLDGTPLLDIKPFVPDFDVRSGVRSGWYECRSRP